MKFTEDENMIILEAARMALADADIYDLIAYRKELSDEFMKTLQRKIEEATNKE